MILCDGPLCTTLGAVCYDGTQYILVILYWQVNSYSGMEEYIFVTHICCVVAFEHDVNR